ncbi:hypothetical protein GCM10027422_34120 [Hymenobacter arcticus]
MRVALCTRISTYDKDQNPENQLVLLHREAERAGNILVRKCINKEFSGKASRTPFQQLMKNAEKRQCDLVRVFAFDCFSSKGIEASFEHTTRLDQCGVAFWSSCEPMLNTTGPMATLHKAAIAWAADYRNQRHSENVRLGQVRKKAQVGKSSEQYPYGR